MSQEQKSAKQKMEEELGELLLSFLNGVSDADREQCLRFVESTLRRLIVVKGDSRTHSGDALPISTPWTVKRRGGSGCGNGGTCRRTGSR
jgi:hypothetical protein